MDYCTEEEHQEFLRSCPEFERMLVRSGIKVIKYWFSVSFEEQRRRFEARNAEPLKRWKLSDMDLAEHELDVRYSMAKDTTFQYTDIKQAPWYVVPSDDKLAARLNCITHLLASSTTRTSLPTWSSCPRCASSLRRPPMHEQTFVPQLFEVESRLDGARNPRVCSIESCHAGIERVVLAAVDHEPAVDAGPLDQPLRWSGAQGSGHVSSAVPWWISSGSVIRSKNVRDDSSR